MVLPGTSPAGASPTALTFNEQLAFMVNPPEVGNYILFLSETYATCQSQELEAVNIGEAFEHVFGGGKSIGCAWCRRTFANLREAAGRDAEK